MEKVNKNVAIIFAGGVGSRMDIENVPKQFLELNDIPIMIYTLLNFENHPEIDGIVISCLESWIDYLEVKLKEFNITKVKKIVSGGNTGQDSIYKALKAAEEVYGKDTIVLIHDGVRPYLKSELISNCIKKVNAYGTAITYTPCNETIVISADKKNIQSVPFRKDTLAGQAPQCFKLGEILSCHDIMREKNPNYENIVDSCTLYISLGKNITLIEGHRGNIKITTPSDYYQFESLLKYDEAKKNGVPVPISDNVINYMRKRK